MVEANGTAVNQASVIRGYPVSVLDQLFLRVWNCYAGTRVRLRASILTPQGVIIHTDLAVTPATNRTESIVRTRLLTGCIINLTAVLDSGAPMRGQTFVQAGVLRGGNTFEDLSALMIQDYIEGNSALAWPGSPLKNQQDGPGALRSYQITSPSPGDEIIQIVPESTMWELINFYYRLTTSPSVQSRQTGLELQDDNSNTLYALVGTISQPASQAWDYNFWRRGYLWSNSGPDEYSMPRPDIWLLSGWKLMTRTSMLHADDEYSDAFIVVREWFHYPSPTGGATP